MRFFTYGVNEHEKKMDQRRMQQRRKWEMNDERVIKWSRIYHPSDTLNVAKQEAYTENLLRWQEKKEGKHRKENSTHIFASTQKKNVKGTKTAIHIFLSFPLNIRSFFSCKKTHTFTQYMYATRYDYVE